MRVENLKGARRKNTDVEKERISSKGEGQRKIMQAMRN